MKISTGTLITVYLWITLTRKNTIKTDDSERCRVHSKDGQWIAECLELDLKFVPGHLNEFLYVLNLSGSIIKELNNDSFAAYTDLHVLDMFNVTFLGWQPTETSIFSKMQELRVLNMSQSSVAKFPSFLHLQGWPMFISVMNFSHNNLNLYMTLMHTPFLEVLDVSGNNLGFTGVISFIGPKHLIMNDNPSIILAAEYFPRMCALEKIELNDAFAFDFLDVYCRCEHTKEWFRFANISHNIARCNFSKDQKCPLWLPDDWLYTYSQCQEEKRTFRKRFQKNKFPGIIIYMLLYFLVVFLICSFIIRHRINYYKNLKAMGLSEHDQTGRKHKKHGDGDDKLNYDDDDEEEEEEEKEKEPQIETTTTQPLKLRKWKIGGK